MIAVSRFKSAIAVAGTVPFTVLSAHRHALAASAELALALMTHLGSKGGSKERKIGFQNLFRGGLTLLSGIVFSHRRSLFLNRMHSAVGFVRCILQLNTKKVEKG